MYINNPDMTSRNIEKKENSSHALVQEDDIQISDSARKLVAVSYTHLDVYKRQIGGNCRSTWF